MEIVEVAADELTEEAEGALAVRGGVHHRLHLQDLLAADRLGVVRVHRRHEHRHRRDDRGVTDEREANRGDRTRRHGGEEANGDLLAGADGGDRDRHGRELDRDRHALREHDLVAAVDAARVLAAGGHGGGRRGRDHRVGGAVPGGNDRGLLRVGDHEVAALADREALAALEVGDRQDLRAPRDLHLDRVEVRLDLFGRDRGAALHEGVRRVGVGHLLGELHLRRVVRRREEGVERAERVGEGGGGGHGGCFFRVQQAVSGLETHDRISAGSRKNGSWEGGSTGSLAARVGWRSASSGEETGHPGKGSQDPPVTRSDDGRSGRSPLLCRSLEV